MPEMNGLEALPELRKLDPSVPIIMFSTLTERGAATTLEALSLGASDYCTKPSNTGSQAESMEIIRTELVPKIKALCKLSVPSPAKVPAAPAAQPRIPRMPHRTEIVAIGTSTGGPNALAEVIPSIPSDFPVPIVIVQHMPPVFTRLLAERLASRSSISVQEGTEGTLLCPGHAWIAPGNHHMVVTREANRFCLKLNQTPAENFCRPAVDVLFRSVAQAFGPGALAVVLTGMGSDGLRGSESIHAAGGEVIIQDEKSSVVWGMPGSIFQSGLSERVFPLSQIATEISRQVSWGRPSSLALQPTAPRWAARE
jgi:two-component system chemotaxis response regulator CheB